MLGPEVFFFWAVQATEEEYSILRRLTGKVLLRKDIGEGDLEAFSDDSDALRSMNSPITTAAFHVTGLDRLTLCRVCHPPPVSYCLPLPLIK